MHLLHSALGRFRVVSGLEGLSYVLLLFVAMPLKYGLDMPEFVSVLGMAHGLLFVSFVLTLVHATVAERWSVLRPAAFLVASLVPFGALWIERSCTAEKSLSAQDATA